MNAHKTIAVVGAGISGLAVSIALRNIDVNVEIFEQAAAFKRIGAVINMTPTAVKVLEGLGIGKPVRETAYVPPYQFSRIWDTGAETLILLPVESIFKPAAKQITSRKQLKPEAIMS